MIKVAHKHFYNLIEGTLFNNLMTLAVFLNTTVLAMDGLFEDDDANNLLTTLNLAFSYIFIIELSCKLIAMGPISINSYFYCFRLC